jgi:hypothetical protein
VCSSDLHVDTGRVRMWPRIPRLELAALFPDGQTKYLPIDGKPITPRDYQLALAKAKQRGETLVAAATPVASPTAQSAAERDVEAPQPILASYTPEPLPAPPEQTAPLPTRKRFVYASASGELPKPASHLSDENFPLYRSAEVVGAPEVDEEHPEELSYVPFEIASLMTDVSVTYNPAAATLTPPEQRNLSYLFEDMDRPLASTFRTTSGYRGLAAAQSFTGHAVRSVYAELAPQQPTRLAQTDR